jgi:hypothetical protein
MFIEEGSGWAGTIAEAVELFIAVELTFQGEFHSREAGCTLDRFLAFTFNARDVA